MDWAIDKHKGTPKASFAALEPGNNPINSFGGVGRGRAKASAFPGRAWERETSAIKSPTTVNLLAYFGGILSKTSGFMAANLSIQRYHLASHSA